MIKNINQNTAEKLQNLCIIGIIMGGPDIFLVQLQGQGVYYGGQIIQGQVQVSNSEFMSNIKSVNIKLIGFGEVSWTERERRTRRRTSSDGDREEEYYETVNYRNHEQYLSNKFPLHQGPLAAGNHVFPFSFVLPPNLPSSFEGQHGHIRYYIEAKLDRSGFFTFDKRKKQFITINSICDLNNIPGVNNSQTNSNSKEFGICCCTSGPLSATVRIPRFGYTPGEVIPISSEIENLSDKRMNATKARLYQDVTFRATNGIKSTTRILQEVRRGPIGAHGSDSWEGVPLAIPAIPPSGLGGCRIIDVTYRLEFIVDPSGIGFDLKISMPIMIGNIPLRHVFQQIVPPRSNCPDSRIIEWSEHQHNTNSWEKFPETDAAAPPPPYQPYNVNQTAAAHTEYGPSAPSLLPTGYADLPPPSYADAVAAHEDGRPNQLRSDRDSEHTDANWDFNPRYPVWSMASAPPQ